MADDGDVAGKRDGLFGQFERTEHGATGQKHVDHVGLGLDHAGRVPVAQRVGEQIVERRLVGLQHRPAQQFDALGDGIRIVGGCRCHVLIPRCSLEEGV